MARILTELCNAESDITKHVYNNTKCQQWLIELKKKRDNLDAVLSHEQKEMLDDYLQEERRYYYECEELYFDKGFSTAVKLIFESLRD